MREPTLVGVGVIERDGRFLIRRRPELPGSPMPGYWEFPGGKCEPGESPHDAVLRECLEETGLPMVVGRLRRVIRHEYPHGYVELHYFDMTTADPSADPAADTGFIWVTAPQLIGRKFPEANDAIVAELTAEFAAQGRGAPP